MNVKFTGTTSQTPSLCFPLLVITIVQGFALVFHLTSIRDSGDPASRARCCLLSAGPSSESSGKDTKDHQSQEGTGRWRFSDGKIRLGLSTDRLSLSHRPMELIWIPHRLDPRGAAAESTTAFDNFQRRSVRTFKIAAQILGIVHGQAMWVKLSSDATSLMIISVWMREEL